MCTKVISATEAKNRLGSYLKAATQHGDAVVIESRNEPAAVLISYSEYQQLRKAQEELAEKEFLDQFDRIMAEQAERNRDLTPEEADEMAIRAVQESRARHRVPAGGQ
jgi:prevent-host-death family protein